MRSSVSSTKVPRAADSFVDGDGFFGARHRNVTYLARCRHHLPPLGYLIAVVKLGWFTKRFTPASILIDVDGRIIHSDTTEADPASSW